MTRSHVIFANNIITDLSLERCRAKLSEDAAPRRQNVTVSVDNSHGCQDILC